MIAYWYENSGTPAEVITLGDMPKPEPGPGEVCVRIAMSAVNPTDCKRRKLGRELSKFPRIIPNNDGAGTIESIGDGVNTNRIGERVWLFGAQANRPFGTAAEFCVVPDAYACHLPDNQSFSSGSCLGVPAVTAHRALYADGDINGHTILISGGAGRVGRYAVQLAKASGATVISTAGSEEKCIHIRNLGADHVLNYYDDDLLARVLDITEGIGVDRMVDVAFGANIELAPKLIRPNGTLTSYSSDGMPRPQFPFLEFMYKNIGIQPFSIFGMPENAKIEAFSMISDLLNEGQISHLIGKEYAFSNMVDAHEVVENGKLFGVCLVNLSD